MRLSEVDGLLNPQPLPLETGYERLDDGVMHLWVRTDMHSVNGRMFEWWFRFQPDTQQYKWWHPIDHGPSKWANTREGTHIGSEHIIEEGFTGLPSQALIIQFREPTEFFNADLYHAARTRGDISGAVCGRIGFTHQPPRDNSGAVLGGRLLHIPRDTPWGCAVRSHFFVGQDLPAGGMSYDQIVEAVTDEFAQALLMHAYNEFTFLSRILPALYAAENHPAEPVSTPR